MLALRSIKNTNLQKSQVPVGLFWANWRCKFFHYSLGTVGEIPQLFLRYEAVQMIITHLKTNIRATCHKNLGTVVPIV